MFYKTVKALVKGFLSVFFRVEVIGESNIPKDNSCLICANHSSNWDPVFLVAFTKRKINFMAKAEVFKIPVLKWILLRFGAFPVQRGKADIGAVKKSMGILNSGEVLGMFPTGTRNSDEESAEVKSGAALIATRCGTTVLPVYIKSNKFKIFSGVKIIYGTPLDMSEYKGKKPDQEELKEIANDIYKNIIELSK